MEIPAIILDDSKEFRLDASAVVGGGFAFEDEDEEEIFESVRRPQHATSSIQLSNVVGSAASAPSSAQTARKRRDDPNATARKEKESSNARPSLDAYVAKMERFELFSTNQCYYLVACDKHNISYRILKMDRTLIERPPEEMDSLTAMRSGFSTHNNNNNHGKAGIMSTDSNVAPMGSGTSSASSGGAGANDSAANAAALDATHRAKPTFRPLSDFLFEDPCTYTQDEIQDMLDMIHHGNRFLRPDGNLAEGGGDGGDRGAGGGGLKPLARGYGIVGFIRFLDCYYLTLITRRAKVGSIGGDGVYTIKNTETFPLKPADRVHGLGNDNDPTDPSSMLLNMWIRGKRSVGLGLSNREIAEMRYQGLYQVVDFTKNFYFSYTYDLTRSLQENFLTTTSQPYPPPPYKDMFCWNFFLTRELEGCISSLTCYYWVMPIVHGAFVQRKLSDYGRILNLALIARRSRHFAGTRYLKRGVSEQGKVANDVEHEQIIHDEAASSAPGGNFSSFLQVRGSIPTFWTQESSVTMPKPPIELNRVDPTYRATQGHFEDLLERYGSPIMVLDLVKQSEKREREVRVGNEFRHAVDYINTSIDDPRHQIRYCALDYSHISKHRNLDVSTSLNDVSTWAVNQTGFFCSEPKWKIVEGGDIIPFSDKDNKAAQFLTKELGVPVFAMEQRGVLRTNCIDCLDRTNVGIFSAGVKALEQQMVVMGIRSSAKLDPAATIIRVLIDMYVEVGDHIALQYGGSEAHKKVSTERSESNSPGPMGKHKELLTSIRRYYSNAFTDRLRQDAMNLLLGFYIPYCHSIPLWEMETDYYLHNLHVKLGRGTSPSMKTYQRVFGVEWSEDDASSQGPHSPNGRAGPVARKAKFEKTRSFRRASSSRSLSAQNQEDSLLGSRESRVRSRCRAQNEALSIWWKVAIQRNIEQRMWMQLGRNPSEAIMPPRFDRLYQPDKIAQFDKFFSRPWATPARRTHSAQQGAAQDGESELTDFRKTISGRRKVVDDLEVNGDDGTLQEFSTLRGFAPQVNPTLKKFIEPHLGLRGGPVPARTNAKQPRARNYVGANTAEEPDPEFVKYASPLSSSSAFPFRREAYDEFKKCLHDNMLESDDVEGIRELARSAHIGRILQSGPYRGLSQQDSAVEVTTVVYEQFNMLCSLKSGGDLSEGFSLVGEELKRRGYSTPGTKDAIAQEWARHEAARQQFSELLNMSNSTCGRSDLTTEDSLRLYSSYFAESTQLSQLDLTFMLGGKAPKPKQHLASTTETSLDSTKQAGKRTFVEKAAKYGYKIPSHAEISKSNPSALFSWSEIKNAPSGFEQINDDMFARKDNKFMVFNSAGVESWKGTEPLTKLLSFPDEDTEAGFKAKAAEALGINFGTPSASE